MKIYRIIWSDDRPDEYYSSLAALYAYRTSDELGIGLRSLYSYMATGGYSGRRIRIEPVEVRKKHRNSSEK